LFLPNDYVFNERKLKIDYEVKCEMMTVHPLESHESNIAEITPTAFYLMPRSSVSNKPIMMANSIGLIDSAYRGNLMSVFRYFPEECAGDSVFSLAKYERIVQIVHPCTYRIFVLMVDSVEDLSTTVRGVGGFGSTGA
jgi:dUTP pyrophosphatase